MASPSSHSSETVRSDEASRNDETVRGKSTRDLARYWNQFELQVVCALVCKGAHLKGTLSFATRLNQTLNGDEGKNDIGIDDIEELLRHIEQDKKAALAFIERQGTSRLTRTQRLVFERNLGFDGSMAEWQGGRKEKVMRAGKTKLEAGAAKGGHFTAADGTRIDRWTPSMRTEVAPTQTDARMPYQYRVGDRLAETGGTAEQPINVHNNVLPARDDTNYAPSYAGYSHPTPAWGAQSTTQATSWGYMPSPVEPRGSAAWGATGTATPRSSTPPWRSEKRQTGTPSGHRYEEPASYPHQHWSSTDNGPWKY
ncbi:hypothetical protein PG987_003941 [Apiospora arundinis]